MFDEAPTPESGAVPTSQATNAKRSMFDDRTVRTMGFLAIGLVIFYLLVVLSALSLGMLNTGLPQTAAERDLGLARVKVQSGSTVERDWAVYAQALADSKQYGRAQGIIDQAKKARLVDPRAQHLVLAQTRLYLAQEQWTKAISAADAGMRLLQKQFDADSAKLKESGTASTMTALGLGENYFALLSIKASALEELGKDDELLKTLDKYITAKPRAADMLEWRGDVRARLGDKQKAVADYKEARQYLGEDNAAIDEKLEKLGDSK